MIFLILSLSKDEVKSLRLLTGESRREPFTIYEVSRPWAAF